MEKSTISMKIGYLMQADAVDMSKVSGPQLHVEAVINGLKNRGHIVRMVAIQNAEIYWSDNMVDWIPTKLQIKPSMLFKLLESTLRGIQDRLKLPFLRFFDSYHFSDACLSTFEGYDILYERYGMLSYGGLIAAKRLGIPHVLEVNGDLIEEYNQLGIQLSKLQWMIINLITKSMFHKTASVIAVDDSIKQRLIIRWNLDPLKITVVPNGADIDLFAQQHWDTQSVRSQYYLGDNQIVIFVGSFQPWQGIDFLLEAFRLVANIKTKVKLVLVGDGLLRSDMESMVKSLKLEHDVCFTGVIAHKEVAALLSIADVAVIYHKASRAANPLKLSEYMAAGKAIIAPQVYNMENMITHRKTGLLIPPEDPIALAKAIVELLENSQLRTELGRAARQEALEKYSWSQVVNKLESLFNGLLAQRSDNQYAA